MTTIFFTTSIAVVYTMHSHQRITLYSLNSIYFTCLNFYALYILLWYWCTMIFTSFFLFFRFPIRFVGTVLCNRYIDGYVAVKRVNVDILYMRFEFFYFSFTFAFISIDDIVRYYYNKWNNVVCNCKNWFVIQVKQSHDTNQRIYKTGEKCEEKKISHERVNSCWTLQLLWFYIRLNWILLLSRCLSKSV